MICAKESAVPNDLTIVVDRNKCTGEAICIGIAPEVFELDDNQISVVINPEGTDRETILEAALSCPQEAIRVLDKKRGSD